MTTPDNKALAAVVASALNRAGIDVGTAANIIGVSTPTMDRRLKRGNFKDVELGALAYANGTRPSVWVREAGQ